MYCSKCGKKIGNNKDKFCKKCGSILTETKTVLSEPEKRDQQTSQNLSPVQKQKSGCCFKVFCAILGLILLFALIGIFVGVSPKILESIKTNTSAPSTKEKDKTSAPKSNTDQNSSTTSAPAQTQTPTPVEPSKQMYYTIGCSNCQNPGCKQSYHYDGYNEGLWIINKTYCEECTCADIKSRSYYR